MTEKALTRQAAGIAVRHLAANMTEAAPEDAASRLLEYVAASASELRDALIEAGARAMIAEARRGVALTIGELAKGECQPCPRCGMCMTCDLEAILGYGHECRR